MQMTIYKFRIFIITVHKSINLQMVLSMCCRLYPNRLLVAGKLKEKNEELLVDCNRKTENGYVTDKNDCLDHVDLDYGLNK
jgi:hypothetical protein